MESSSTQMKQLINILQSSAARADKVPTTLTKLHKNICESVKKTKIIEVIVDIEKNKDWVKKGARPTKTVEGLAKRYAKGLKKGK